MTQPDWDDDRLGAAFQERFDGSAPAGLEKSIHVRIVGTSPARFGGMHVGRAWPLAAAAVVVILVAGIAMIDLGGGGRIGTSSIPPNAEVSASSEGQATPTEQALPTIIFDLPVIHVSEAIAIRDAGVDEREIAVLGWFSDGGPIPCPAPNVFPINPLELECPDEFVWLMERPETLISHSGTGVTIAGPSGPFLNPDLDGVDRSWEPRGGGVLDANGLSVPIDVVLVGHFDDRRAALCPKAEVAACRDRFVVDSVARVHGVEPPPSVIGGAPGSTTSTVADVEAIVANVAQQGPILSIVVVDPSTDLSMVEPSLTVKGDGTLVRSTVWVVRVLETDRVATYIVADGTDTIYEMNPDNRPVQVGGKTPGASAEPVGADGRDYELDCGPLSPDACAAKAAAVVAATQPKQVVSISFKSECGSYLAIFDDGTAVGASIDCIPLPESS